MSGSQDPHRELDELLAALCDGELDSAQAARLEELAARSPEARRFFLEYLQLHGELYWDHASSAGRSAETSSPPGAVGGVAAPGSGFQVQDSHHPTSRFPQPTPRLLMLFTAVAAAVLVVVAGWLTIPTGDEAMSMASAPVATLTGTAGAVWDDAAAPGEREELAAGRTLRLRQGLAEITFFGGAAVVIQGPVTFRLESDSAGRLDAGRLSAVVPARAVGFSIRTPSAVVIDRGTEFGLVVKAGGPSEVHVFAGAVDVEPSAGDARPRRLEAGQAVRLAPTAGDAEAVAEIALAEHDFVRRLPGAVAPARTVAALRRAVSETPDLIHHYTFEGNTRAEKCRDSRGSMNLAEAVMADGRGGGEILYSAEGFDDSTDALRPFRGVENGNTSGVSLQSEAEFHPPAEMTVELLLNFDGNIRADDEALAAAVATRSSERDCGFLVSSAFDGRIVFLLDARSTWGESDLLLQPGQWYYVAATFYADADQTTVNLYAANLSRAERTLRQVARDVVIPGTPATSRLGIGKAFDGSTAHAYPWAGSLDEVAIYDAVLDRRTLQSHLDALASPKAPADHEKD